MFRTPSTTPFKERLEARRRSRSESLILRRQKIPNDKSYLLIFLAKTSLDVVSQPLHNMPLFLLPMGGTTMVAESSNPWADGLRIPFTDA